MPGGPVPLPHGMHNKAKEMLRRLAQGFADTPTTQIASEAGVTRGALYHHFSDKTALFHAVFVELENALNDAVVHAATESRHDLRTAFRAGTRALLEFATSPEYRQIAVADGPAVVGMAEWHRIDTDIGMASLHLMLDAFHAEGELATRPSPTRSVLLFGALTQAAVELGRATSTLSIDEIVDDYERLVLGD